MAFRGQAGVAKIEIARVAAAALAYLIAGQGDAIGLVTYDTSVRHYVPSRIGQTHLRTVLATLAGMRPSGTTSAAQSVRRSIDFLTRRGLLILISDLYDEEEGVEAELRRAVRMGHEVALFHVLTRDELEFPFGADVELEDLESGKEGPDRDWPPRPTIDTRSRSFSSAGMRDAPAIGSTTRAS